MSEVEFVSTEPQAFEVCPGEVLTIDTGFGVAHTVEGKPIPPGQNGSSIIELYGDESFTVQGADGVEYTIRGRGAAEGRVPRSILSLAKERALLSRGVTESSTWQRGRETRHGLRDSIAPFGRSSAGSLLATFGQALGS